VPEEELPEVPLEPDVVPLLEEEEEDEEVDVPGSPDVEDDVVSGPPVQALIVAAPAKTSAARVRPFPRAAKSFFAASARSKSAEQNGHEVSFART
jgi:hypothetical protein